MGGQGAEIVEESTCMSVRLELIELPSSCQELVAIP